MASAAALNNDTAVAEPDAETIGVYDSKRDEFDEMVRGERKTGDNRGALAKDAARVGFADALTPGARVLDYDRFDETAIDWKRIAEYEKELNGGTWPRDD